jgi:hypothetical protein
VTALLLLETTGSKALVPFDNVRCTVTRTVVGACPGTSRVATFT